MFERCAQGLKHKGEAPKQNPGAIYDAALPFVLLQTAEGRHGQLKTVWDDF